MLSMLLLKVQIVRVHWRVIHDVKVEMSAKYVWAMKALWKISLVAGDETSSLLSMRRGVSEYTGRD